MAYLFNGATHQINRADAVVTTWPLTFFGRIRLTGTLPTGLEHAVIGLYESATNDGFRLAIEDRTGSMKARMTSKAGGAASAAESTTAITDNAWHTVIGEVTAAAARQVWLDNGGNASNVVSRAPGTIAKTTIGAINTGGTLSANVGHEVADVAVWAGTLTADERAALHAGISPALIRPDILKIYTPLIRGAVDQRGGTFTVTDATVADHPRVFMPAVSGVVPVPPLVVLGDIRMLFAPEATGKTGWFAPEAQKAGWFDPDALKYVSTGPGIEFLSTSSSITLSSAAILSRNRGVVTTASLALASAVALSRIRGVTVSGMLFVNSSVALSRIRGITTAGSLALASAATLQRLRPLATTSSLAMSQASILQRLRGLSGTATASLAATSDLSRIRGLATAGTLVAASAANLVRTRNLVASATIILSSQTDLDDNPAGAAGSLYPWRRRRWG